MREIKISGT